jgi:cell division transport system permease protein
MIGLFALLALNAHRLTEALRQKIEVQLFLERDLSDADRQALAELLAQKPYTDRDGSEARLRYLSRDQAAKAMIEETGEDFVAFLGENPLRDSYILHLQPAYSSREQLMQIKDELETLPQVYEVVYGERLIEEINTNITKIGFVLVVFAGIFLVTVFILINNAIKLALFSQRFLIRSMQLVGATPLFIKKPFLLRASVQGVVSGLIASLFLSLLLWFFMNQIRELREIQDYLATLVIFVSLMLLGAGIGSLSAYMAVSRYLKMRLDELY